MKYSKILFFFLLLTLFIDASSDRAIYRKTYGKENKVALVIGNSNYTHFSPLKNTLHDAEDIQQILKSKGFDVLYLKDGDLESMESMVEKFAAKLRKGGVGFFYYAGHGLEVEGNNYLVPVGANISSKNKVKYKSLPINMVIDEMEDSHNRLNIIVLDACRNDPFSNDRDIGGSGGLAQINNAKGMYIAFATAPGETASDGKSGKNGLFTKHLIKNIGQKNLTLNDVFKKTRAAVYAESRDKQLPWTSSSVIGDFYFHLDTTSQTNTTVPLPSSVTMSESDKKELQQLRLIKQQKTDAALAELVQLRKELKNKPPKEARVIPRESHIPSQEVRPKNDSTQDSYEYRDSKDHYFPYVCYSEKFSTTNAKATYIGCIRSNRVCNTIRKNHFGKYPNDAKAHSAFKRCTQGNPKSNSSQGSYVCYSKKIITHTNNVIYEGCNISEIQCNKRGKLHFGKYNTNIKVNSALNRCRKGNPKFTDSQGL